MRTATASIWFGARVNLVRNEFLKYLYKPRFNLVIEIDSVYRYMALGLQAKVFCVTFRKHLYEGE